ncbi:hypothetical protein DL93DRAFT_2091041 [Clavulina sp. PMI_390]|nr:hypothetical protein DL93DRAFT_2091041 [Clavulina sp. PMI_390]
MDPSAAATHREQTVGPELTNSLSEDAGQFKPVIEKGFAQEDLQSLELSPFVLECIEGMHSRNPPNVQVSPTLSDTSSTSTRIFAGDTTAGSPDSISAYEKLNFYNGVTAGGGHPQLFYRSDLLTNPFPAPTGSFPSIPKKTVCGVYDTPLNKCWHTVAPKIVDLLKSRTIEYSAINPIRFYHYGPLGTEEGGKLGPITMWIVLRPDTTTVRDAREASLAILEILRAHGIHNAVVEWFEGAFQKLSGPPLLRTVNNTNPTYDLRRPFNATIGMPIAPAQMENDDAEGTVAFFFHENKDGNGAPIDTVLGVSCCHILRRNPSVDFQFTEHAAHADYVRVNGYRGLQRSLRAVKESITGHGIDAITLDSEIALLSLQSGNEDQDVAADNIDALALKKAELAKKEKSLETLQNFYEQLITKWADIDQRNVGYVHWAPRFCVDNETKYTQDLGTFVADPNKFKDSFKGNVVSLGLKYSAQQLVSMFHLSNEGQATFTFPPNGEMRIDGVLDHESLVQPDCYDRDGKPCIMVMKNGCTTGLTVGRCTSLESYTRGDTGVESIDIAVYDDSGLPGPFSARGDSGSLIFDGLGRMVGLLHSSVSDPMRGNSCITYATPAWWVIEKLKERYPHADFSRTSF